MRTKILTLGLIFLVLIACKNIENPYSSAIPDMIANVEMIGTPLWYSRVYTTSCPNPNWEEEPYFGFAGRLNSSGNDGVLKNTGTKTAYNVRLIIKMYSNPYTDDGVFLGQTTVPSDYGCSHFFQPPYEGDYNFSYCVLESEEVVEWKAFLPHEGNDWRERVSWPNTQYIIEWN